MIKSSAWSFSSSLSSLCELLCCMLYSPSYLCIQIRRRRRLVALVGVLPCPRKRARVRVMLANIEQMQIARATDCGTWLSCISRREYAQATCACVRWQLFGKGVPPCRLALSKAPVFRTDRGAGDGDGGEGHKLCCKHEGWQSNTEHFHICVLRVSFLFPFFRGYKSIILKWYTFWVALWSLPGVMWMLCGRRIDLWK